MNLDDSPDGGLEVVSLGLRGVEYLHGVGPEVTRCQLLSYSGGRSVPARHVHQGGVVEVGLELARVQGGGHDHQLQVLAK